MGYEIYYEGTHKSHGKDKWVNIDLNQYDHAHGSPSVQIIIGDDACVQIHGEDLKRLVESFRLLTAMLEDKLNE